MNQSVDKLFSLVVFVGCAVAIFLLGDRLTLEYSLYWHIGSFLALGLLYEIPELSLGLFAVRVTRIGREDEWRRKVLYRIVGIRLVLTHFLGPLFGVMTVLSGFCLIYKANHSLAEGWLFWIIGLAAAFVSKGLFQHNVFIRRVYGMFEQNASVSSIHKALSDPWETFLNILEFPAYIFIFCADHFKPGWPTPARDFLVGLSDQMGHPVFVSMIYFGLIFLITWFVFRRWSPSTGRG